MQRSLSTHPLAGRQNRREWIGSLIIKEKFGLSDIETVEMIAENPYMQYFIGLEAFSKKAPMEASLLTWFRKRISPEMLSEINDYIIGRKTIEGKKNDPPDGPLPTGGNTGEDDDKNKGTLILFAVLQVVSRPVYPVCEDALWIKSCLLFVPVNCFLKRRTLVVCIPAQTLNSRISAHNADGYLSPEHNISCRFAANNRPYPRLMNAHNPVLNLMRFIVIHLLLLFIQFIHHRQLPLQSRR